MKQAFIIKHMGEYDINNSEYYAIFEYVNHQTNIDEIYDELTVCVPDILLNADEFVGNTNTLFNEHILDELVKQGYIELTKTYHKGFNKFSVYKKLKELYDVIVTVDAD